MIEIRDQVNSTNQIFFTQQGKYLVKKMNEIYFPADFTEGVSVSKEYNGEQGRYLPPRQGRPVLQQSMSHQ